jgi:hypothetical protein
MEDALLYLDLTRILLSFRDIRKNGFHVETHMDNKRGISSLYQTCCIWQTSSLQTGLYFTYTKPIEHVAYKIIFQDVDTF